jgi:lipid A 4'-phosphatase
VGGAAAPMTRNVLYPATLVAATLLFLAFPGLDLWASGLFYRPGEGFFLQDWPPFRLVYDLVPHLTQGVVLLVLAGFLWWWLRRRPLLGLDRRAMIFLLASLAVGPGLLANSVLKDHWGRARPAQVAEFGGGKRFTPAVLPTDQCVRNCSFVAGHAAMGFYLVSFAFLVRERRRRRIAEAAALAAGAVVGLTRIAQGGHFLSDVVFAGLVVYGSAWALHHWIVVRDGLAPPLRRLRAALGRVPGAWASVCGAPGGRLGVAATATFLVVAASILWLDRPIARYFDAHRAARPVFEAITKFGDSTWYLVGAALAFLALRLAAARPRFAAHAARLAAYARVPLFLFTAIAAPGLAVDLLKTVVGRTRPKLLFAGDAYDFTFWATRADHWSFPSGHTATIVALATALYVLWPRWLPLYLLAAAMVAASRVVLNQHYLSDVAFAAFLAVTMTAYVKLVFERSGIDLAAAAAGRLGEREKLPWRRRFGLRRQASVTDSP